uniref:Uncharacterized protein n=1 Tax=Lepeophtheirus salmonis TaxID=72036 RepID=A0A0K2UZS6_LEPSM
MSKCSIIIFNNFFSFPSFSNTSAVHIFYGYRHRCLKYHNFYNNL